MFEQTPLPTQEKPKEKFPNVDAESAKILEQIDFDELKNTFGEFIESVGLDPDLTAVVFIDNPENFKKSIGVLNDGFMAIDPMTATIFINWDACKVVVKFYEEHAGNDEEKEQIRKQLILKLICHEEAHAVSFFKTAMKKSESPDIDVVLNVKAGYKNSNLNVKENTLIGVDSSYNVFNEAITEIIGKKVFEEYMRKKGEDVYAAIHNNDLINPYLKVIHVFDDAINIICKEAGIEKDILEKVIFRGYFAGEDLSGGKMKKLFNNIFPENFETKLAKWHGGNNEEISEMIKECNWTEQDRKRVRRWIMSVYNTMPNSQKK